MIGAERRSEERSGCEWIIGLLVVVRVFLLSLSAPLWCCCALRGAGWERRCGTSSRLHYSQAKNGGGRRAGSGIRLLCPGCINAVHDAFLLE